MKSSKTQLFLLPGTMCNELLWEDLAPFLADSCELSFLSIPNNLSFEQLADHYAEQFSGQQINLLGFSLGGYVAAWFATAYPDLIKSLFIVANSPVELPESELTTRKNALRFVDRNGYPGIPGKRVKSLLDPKNHTEDLIHRIQKMDSQMGQATFVSQTKMLSERQDLAEKLADISTPLHFCFSEGDNLVNTGWIDELALKRDGITVEKLSGNGHMVPLEQAEQLANVIIKGLAKD